MDLLGPVPDRIGRYVVEDRLGAGGMAEAFLAYVEGVEGFKRAVVLKRLLPHMWADPNAEQMFLREAKVGMRLQHQNIVRVFELGKHEGAYFMAMEYLAGMSLRAAAKRSWALERAVPLPVVMRAIADAARGLQYAHTLVDARGQPDGLVHRDISPDNLMMSREGITKILDFGIVKRTTGAEPITRTGEIKGKIGYMAPEQLEGEDADHRVDLFALGVTFYWLVAGHRPFVGKNEIMTIKAVLEDAPKPLREIDASVPPEIDGLVLELLAKKKEDRPPTAEHVARRLESMVGRTDPTGEAGRFIEEMLGFGAEQPEKKPRPISWDGSPPPDNFAEVSLEEGPSGNDGTRVTLRELPSLPAGFLASDDGSDPLAPQDTALAPSPVDTMLNPVAEAIPEQTLVTAKLPDPTLDQTLDQPLDQTIITEPVPGVSALSDEPRPAPTLVTEMPPRNSYASTSGVTEVVTRKRVLPKRSRTPRVVAGVIIALVVVGLATYFALGGEEEQGELLWGDKPNVVAVTEPVPVEEPVADPGAAAPDPAPPTENDALDDGSDTEAVDENAVDENAVDENVVDEDEVDDGAELGSADPEVAAPDGEPGDATPRTSTRKPAAKRRVVVTAPDHVKWLDSRGNALGTGSGTLQVPARTKRLRAIDKRTGGRISVPVKSRIFWKDLPRGRMAFVVLPWAKVTLGRTSLGTTPLKPVDLPAGTYTATLTYKDTKVQKRVVVRSRADATVKHDFRK